MFKTGSVAIDMAIKSKGAWKSRLAPALDQQGFKDDLTRRSHAARRLTAL